jgi:6-phosphofructokinase 1
LASRLGIAAVQALMDEQRNVMVGIQNEEIVLVPLTKAIHQKKDIKEDKWQAMLTLSI